MATVAIVVLSYFIAQFVGAQLVYVYPYIHGWGAAQTSSWLKSSVAAQFFYVLIAETLTLLTLWLFVRRRITLKSLGLIRVRWRDVGYAVVGVLAYVALFLLVINLIIQPLTSVNVSQEQDLGFNNVAGASSLLITFVSLVALPPIVEEITFRGFLYSGLRHRMAPIWATLLTSLLFATPHLLESSNGQGLLWVAGIDTFILSLVLCYLREKSKSLWASIGVHMVKNSIAFVSLFIVHLR